LIRKGVKVLSHQKKKSKEKCKAHVFQCYASLSLPEENSICRWALKPVYTFITYFGVSPDVNLPAVCPTGDSRSLRGSRRMTVSLNPLKGALLLTL